MNLLITILLMASFLQADTTEQATDTTSAVGQDVVNVISIDGSISPTTTNYIRRAIEDSRSSNAEALLIELDTPGGLLDSTEDIVQMFLDSDDLPIIVYVTPRGASATSAGTFITMAAHIAAMSPATTIGSASPVSMGGGEQDTVMQKKVFNYSESFIETIAEERDRNAEWARSAVRDGESLTSSEALEMNVINFIADDRADLFNQMDGMVINDDTLRTRDAQSNEIPANLAEMLLGFIMRPEVMLILTMIAIYGIIGEVTNPGAIVPGVAGVIALILVLFASAAMPINVAGFALIGLAVVLFVAEAFTPAFGVLIAGGSISFFIGALMLFQELPESMELSWAWLVPATVITTLFFVWIVTEGVRIQFSNNVTGKESMIGKEAEVTDDMVSGRGRIFVNGEYWTAVSNDELKAGDTCEIEEIDGLTVKVKRINDNTS